MPSALSRSFIARVLAVAMVAGLLGSGLMSASAMAEAPPSPGRVSGLILNRSNEPIVAATVTLTDISGTAFGTTDSDGQGHWSLSAPQGTYDISVTARQNGRTLAAQLRQYVVGAGSRLNLVLVGDPQEGRVATTAAANTSPTFARAAAATPSSVGTVTFSGEVVDSDGNRVTSGVDISLSQPVTYDTGSVAIADDGSFSFEVPAGTYKLGVATGVVENDCYGCVPERSAQQERDYEIDNFQLNGDRHETIRLPRPTNLAVTVVDPAGRPVAGAWIETEPNSPQPTVPDLLFPGALTTVFTLDDQLTGADGTANLEYIPGAAPAMISVEPPPGTTLPGQAPFPPQGGAVTIHLQDGLTLHGRLVDAAGTPLVVSEAYLSSDTDSYPFGAGRDGYAVTATAGRYRMFLQDAHDEEGESSDYQLWTVQSDPFELTAGRTLNLTVPLGYAHLWAVDSSGQPLDGFDGFDGTIYRTTSQPFSIADGISATAVTTPADAYYDSSDFPVIGPSTADLNSPDLPNGAYVAPGEDTVIAFAAGTGPNDPSGDNGTTTTTSNTQPTTTPQGTDPAPGATRASTTGRSGYWALGSDGHVYTFGDVPALGNAAGGAVDLEPTPSGRGYWILNSDGVVQALGDATKLGDVALSLTKGEEPASLSATPSGKGYWVFTNRGRVLAIGDAPFLGDMSQTKLNGPVLGSVATPSGKGYYMVASDGGIFAFGDATFAGSMGGRKLNAPVQSLVPDSDGQGYWLVASDGGIFAFDAPFRGSMGGTKLNKPVVGMVRYGDGYLMVGADGGIFNFSATPFAGSLGDKPPAAPVVAVAALPGT